MYGIEFKNPEFLFLLVPFVIMILLYYMRSYYQRESAIAISSEQIVTKDKTIRVKTYRLLPLFRFLAIIFLIIALARPGKGFHYSSVKNLGIDIMITLDVSYSMIAEDFKPKNRLTVAKQVIKDFIKKRNNDRIGLVVFSGDAYLQCPLTIEHQVILEIIDEIDFETVKESGTAIGEAVALSASRMMDSKAKSRIILLLTDGRNNRGSIDPETAAGACAEMGIKAYTVGIGSMGKAAIPLSKRMILGRRYFENEFDEKTLKSIADITKARYYRATSSGVLWERIKDIDRLERSTVDAHTYHDFRERFMIPIIIAIFLFFTEVLLRSVFFRKIP